MPVTGDIAFPGSKLSLLQGKSLVDLIGSQNFINLQGKFGNDNLSNNILTTASGELFGTRREGARGGGVLAGSQFVLGGASRNTGIQRFFSLSGADNQTPAQAAPALSTGAQQRTQARGQASTILSGDFGSSGAGVGRGTVAFKTLSGF